VSENARYGAIFGMPFVPNIVGQLAKLGESLCLAFPNTADTTDFWETPA